MKEFLESFRLGKYRFILRPHEFLKLSSYAGSSLRRDFIPAFKRISCTEAHGECSKCSQQENCVFYMVMENRIRNADDEYLKRFQTPPKPFIFEPPLARKSYYTNSEELVFDLLLIGKALRCLPNFISTFRCLAEQGIGKNQGKFTLCKILGVNLLEDNKVEELTFDSKQSLDKDISVSLAQLYEHFQLEGNGWDQIHVSFLTPLRMKRAGSETWHLPFRALVKNLLTRISNLACSYCDYPEFFHFPDIVYEAGTVRTVRENLIWENWRSPQRKGNGSSKLGGYRGNIVYQGDLAVFWPWLKLAEILHVGKNCSFGLGRVAVEARS